MSVKLSIILTTFNEVNLGFLPKSLKLLLETPQVEVIIVDHNSTDETKPYLESLSNIKLIYSDKDSRAARLNQGIEAASGEMILLHHSRSILEKEGVDELLALSNQKIWGGFTHRFDINNSGLLSFTSWWSNYGRFGLTSIVYLDHCIFFHKELMGKQPVIPEVDIFEDTEISKKLRRIKRPIRLKSYATTSSIRFQKNGIWKQAIMNQVLKIGYHFKIPHTSMNKIYEKGLSLNTNYDSQKKS